MKTNHFRNFGISMMILLTSTVGAANLLDGRDPGFEASVANGTFPSSGYWQPAWLGTGGAICTSTAAHSGGTGLWEYTGNLGSDWWSGQYQVVTANPGEVFSASAWLRSQSSWVSGSKALVRLELLNSASGVLATKDSPAITTVSSAWQQLSARSDPAPSGTAYVRIRLYLEKPNGTAGQSIANFDDCLLEKIAVTQPILSVSPVVLGFGSDLTTLSFEITNLGNATLTWNITKNAPWISVSPTNGTTTTEGETITVMVDRTGLNQASYSAAITISSDGGNRDVEIFMETAQTGTVPTQPAIVSTKGYQLMVQRRLSDGSLDIESPYIIKGAAWTPAGIGTNSSYFSRRGAFGDWYRLDIQLLKEMNANTVYVFLDPGTDPATVTTARTVLDYCYRNGIMVIMTVDEDGSDNTANIPQVINAFKNHPAILMWALGNEWNLWRPDRPE